MTWIKNTKKEWLIVDSSNNIIEKFKMKLTAINLLKSYEKRHLLKLRIIHQSELKNAPEGLK